MSSFPRKHDGSTTPKTRSIVGTIRLSSTAKESAGPSKKLPMSLKEKLDEAIAEGARTIFLTEKQLFQTPWLNRLPTGEFFYRNIPVRHGNPGYALPNKIVPIEEIVMADGHSYKVVYG